MRILLINHYAGTLEYGMEYRPYYFAREWVELGHRVDIIAADYSHLRIKNPVVKRNFEKTQIDGINYHWIKAGKYKGNGVKRAFSMIRFVITLFFHARKLATKIKPDVVISSSTYPLDTYPAQKIAKLVNAKHIHEVHDMWPLTLIELGGMSKYHPFIMLMQKAENDSLKKSHMVVSLLTNSKQYMVEHGMNEDKFYHIPNGIVPTDWDNPTELPDTHQGIISMLKKQGKFIVCYFGGHALSNALIPLIDAAQYTDVDKVSFILVGEGIEKNNLILRAKKQKSNNIIFLPSIPKRSIPNLLRQVDLLYIGAAKSPLYRFGVSMNKLFDAMIAGKPILYAVEAANNDVEEAKCGITVEPGNSRAIADAINKIMQMGNDELAKMGENGKRWVLENNDYSVLARKFINLMSELK